MAANNKGKQEKVKNEKRVPLGVPRLRLDVKKKPGYKRRWINDRGDRIAQALEGGYRLVGKDDTEFTDEDTANRNDALNNAMSKIVNSDGTKAYLMEIPIPWYVEDQKKKMELVDATENGLRQGMDEHGAPGRDGRYIPEEGIKISK